MSQYRFYLVEVHFKNEGEIYGRESYRVMAADEDNASAKALKNAEGSNYNDDRLPDRRMVVASCEAEEDLAA